MFSATPDRSLALEHYARHAPVYDRATRRMEPVRHLALERLDPRPGDVVLDVACGTGKSLAAIVERIGARGTLYGIDQSPEMLARARARVREAGWRNVVLLDVAAEDLRLDARADAVLFHFAHDVLQSPAALAQVFAHVRGGARVVSAGMKYFHWWLAPLNPLVRRKARTYTTTLSGFDCPWRGLAAYVDALEVRPLRLGLNYVAHGRARG